MIERVEQLLSIAQQELPFEQQVEMCRHATNQNISDFIAELQTFKSSIADAIRPYLCEGRPNIGRTAQVCDMTSRTLQRRLKDEGLNYSQLLDEMISYIAKDNLIYTDKIIADIALELAYALATHFTRSFKKHLGVTPKEFRNQNLNSSKSESID